LKQCCVDRKIFFDNIDPNRKSPKGTSNGTRQKQDILVRISAFDYCNDMPAPSVKCGPLFGRPVMALIDPCYPASTSADVV
jgi:hypothetical protein